MDDDGGIFPFAQDLDGMWHRRPEGDLWVTSAEEPNCRTACGQAISSVRVSEYEPSADESTGATLCRCVSGAGELGGPRVPEAPSGGAGDAFA